MLTFVLQYQDFESAWYCATSFWNMSFSLDISQAATIYFSGLPGVQAWINNLRNHNLPTYQAQAPMVQRVGLREKSKMSLLNQI